MNRLLLLILLPLTLFIRPATAQSTLRGVVTDAQTGTPLEGISVYIPLPADSLRVGLPDEPIGTATDANGVFTLTLPAQIPPEQTSIRFSAVGYSSKSVPAQSLLAAAGAQRDTIALESYDRLLGTVVVTPGKEQYDRHNPAVRLLQRVKQTHQTQRALLGQSARRVQVYEKLLLAQAGVADQGAFWGIPAAKAQEFKSPSLLYPGKVVPLSLRERSLVQYAPAGRALREAEFGKRHYGPDEVIDEESLTRSLYELLNEVDLYAGGIYLMNQSFAGPLSSVGLNGYYRYALTDTLREAGRTLYRVSVAPAVPQDGALNGFLSIDSAACAIARAHLEVNPRANKLLFHRLRLYCEYTPQEVDGGAVYLLPSHQTVLTSIRPVAFLSAAVEAYAQRNYSGYLFGSAAERAGALDPRLDLPQPLQARTRSRSTGNYGWVERPVMTAPREEQAVSLVQYLSANRLYRGIWQTAHALYTGFVPIPPAGLWGQRAYLEAGPVESTVGANTAEGLRLRLGGTTTALFSPHFFLEGYAAYAFGDRKPKYYLRATYSFSKKDYYVHEYPVRSLSAYVTRELYSPAVREEATLYRDHLFDLPAHFSLPLRYYAFKAGIEGRWDLSPVLGVSAGAEYARQDPFLAPYQWGGTAYPLNGRTDLFLLRGLLTWRPKGLPFRTRRPTGAYYDLQKEKPLVTLEAELYPQLTSGMPSTFGRVRLAYRDKIYLGLPGFLKLRTHAEAVIGRAPFTLLATPPLNRSLILTLGRLQSLPLRGVLANQSVFMMAEYHLGGLLFNRLPGVNRLGFQEVFTLNAYYGHYRGTDALIRSELPTLRGTHTPLPFFTPARNLFFSEVGIGIEKILGLFRVDLFLPVCFLQNGRNLTPQYYTPAFRGSITLFL